MSYNKDFKNITDVCEKFNLNFEKKNFIKEKKIKLNGYFINKIDYFLNDEGSYLTETAICERIIFPLIFETALNNNLPVWSQLRFDVDKKLKLTGNPDYIIAPALRGGQNFKLPVVCLGEAKKNDFEQGWGQVLSEMYAAQIKNNNKKIRVFGIVSDGKSWEFGNLIENNFIKNKIPIVAIDNLSQLLNSLNWMFCEARKNADQLLEMENNTNKE